MVEYEMFCRSCGCCSIVDDEYQNNHCPDCGSDHIVIYPIVQCCGMPVACTGFTNICPECGKMYDHNGTELAPVDEWDPDDRYACFGPQNGDEGW